MRKQRRSAPQKNAKDDEPELNDQLDETEEPETKKARVESDESAEEISDATQTVKSSILTNTKFEILKDKVTDRTLKKLDAMGYKFMTEIQERSIQPLLEVHVLGAAKTGSGKTLAFLIPAIELLLKLNWKQHNGTGVIIISPTRELSMQTYGVVSELLEVHTQLTHGLIMGGANRQAEAQRLLRGVAVIVATPGRLLDHMQNTEGFVFKNMKCLVIDEADRILDIGFEIEMQQILRRLPKKRQSMLFSATQTPKVDELVKQALHSNPVRIGVESKESDEATVEGLEQGYVACPSEKRFLLLFTFLKKNRNKKVMVFFSSCASVKYHQELLNYIDVPVMSIHGKQKQQKRTCTFFSFCQAKSGILLCTDVAARGLDIPQVDWIVQYDPPDEPREYIHRVGRTARGETGTGHALLILRPEELGFLRFLKAARVTLNEYEFSWNKIPNIQPQLEKIISQNYYLNKSAKEGYKAYVRAYDSHALKQIFDVNTLDLVQVAKSSQKIKPREKYNGAGFQKKSGKLNDEDPDADYYGKSVDDAPISADAAQFLYHREQSISEENANDFDEQEGYDDYYENDDDEMFDMDDEQLKISEVKTRRGTSKSPARMTPNASFHQLSAIEVAQNANSTHKERHRDPNAKPQVNLVIVGHVDAGKSTLVGHLLYLLGQVDEKAMNRERGVTMDIAHASFETTKRRFNILDAPGHRDFIPNMITASQADAALLVVNASRGEFETGFDLGGQTREHALLLRALGVQKVMVAVNKMDTIEWSQERYEEVVDAMKSFLKKQAGFSAVKFIPVSGLGGENLLRRPDNTHPLTQWYDGPTLSEILDTIDAPLSADDKPLRLIVNDVVKTTNNSLSFTGKIETGHLESGDRVYVMPKADAAVVKAVNVADSESQHQSVNTQNVCFAGDQGSRAECYSHAIRVPCIVAKLRSIINKQNGEVIKANPRVITKGMSAIVEISTDYPVCVEPYSKTKQLGRVSLRINGRTVGAGIVDEIIK
ncbi:RNA helicase [Aphelenchoides besseyi]|nr:RNA helicase [Aphelenchoides besseyi]